MLVALMPVRSGAEVNSTRHADLAIGDAAPDLTVERWHNTEKPFDLKSLRGKVVLLDFWGVWCKPCVQAVPKLKTLAKDYKDASFQIIMIHTPMKSEQIESFVNRNDLSLPIAVDKGEARSAYGKTTEAYHVRAFPRYFLIDKKGVLRAVQLNDPPSRELIDELLAE